MKDIKISVADELKGHTKTLLQTMALVQMIHPKVRKYQKAILKEIEAKDKYTGEAITDPNLDYLMSDDQAKLYFRRCHEEADKEGLPHKPDGCPLLEVEDMERDAKRFFCECVLPYIPQMEGLTYDDLLEFAKDTSGNDKKDNLGRYMFEADELIDLVLNHIIPQLDEKELKQWQQLK